MAFVLSGVNMSVLEYEILNQFWIEIFKGGPIIIDIFFTMLIEELARSPLTALNSLPEEAARDLINEFLAPLLLNDSIVDVELLRGEEDLSELVNDFIGRLDTIKKKIPAIKMLGFEEMFATDAEFRAAIKRIDSWRRPF